MSGDLLPRLPDEGFQRVLCVAAHPDDIEYGTSPAVAAWTARGAEVGYLLLTRGEAGMDGLHPERTAVLRTREQIEGSARVGVTRVEFREHPDGVLEYGLPLRRDIALEIRRFRPDVVLVGSWEVEFVVGLNQADHRAVGLATIDAVRDAGNRWVFPDQLTDGLEPWSPRWILATGDPRPTHGVPIDDEALARGVASLEAHEQYLAGLPGHPPPSVLIPAIATAQGRALGVPHAVLFRAFDLQAPPPIALDGA